MLCEHCGKKNATVYYKQTVNGKTNEYRLCADCAEALRHAASPGNGFFAFPSLFGDGDFFSPSTLFARPEKERKSRSVKTCPLCGSRYDELLNTGKMGCAECYTAFREEIEKTLLSLHGRATHIGRSPKSRLKTETVSEEKTQAPEAPKPTVEQDELASLKAELQKAVAEEKYEQAASLRDRIRAMENKPEQKEDGR